MASNLRFIFCKVSSIIIFCMLSFTGPHAALKTAYAWDTLFPTYYQNSSELPDRVIWINNRRKELKLTDSLLPVSPIDSPISWIRKVHTPEHIQGIRPILIDTANGATHSIGEIADLAINLNGSGSESNSFFNSSVESTVGRYFTSFARIVDSSPSKGRQITCLKRNNNALKAWFCSEAETLQLIARYSRNILTSATCSVSGFLCLQ